MSISARAVAAVQKPKNILTPGSKCVTCGTIIAHPRNYARRAKLFAFLPAVLNQWPAEKTGFKPLDRDHLRSWLLCEANFCEVDELEFTGADPQRMVYQITAFMNRHHGHKYVHYKETETGIRALIPKSISDAKCSEKDFLQVFNSIVEIVELTLGCSIETLKKEADRVI